MSDEQLARALFSAGLLTREQLVTAAQERHAGERLGRTVLRLGFISPDEISRFDPNLTNDSPVPPGADEKPPQSTDENEAVYGLGERAPIEGRFWVEGEEEADQNFEATQMPVVRWANELLRMAIARGASDLHLEPAPDGLLPRFRVDGQLRPGQKLPVDVSDPIISRLKILAGLDITEDRRPQDGRFRAHYGERVFDFRVSSLPSLHGEKLVLRLLDHGSLVTDLARLGFGREALELLHDALGRSHGLFLVTGPTGSGKTTTLYAALSATRDEALNVVTVEDPIEYELKGVTQTAVDSNIGLSFATILRAVLRQDPDIILVGEIRDEETADIAVRAALTGHLVLATLHTNSSVGAITRLEDMGVPTYLLSAALSGVVAQRLVRLNCRFCREEIGADDPAREEWAEFFGWPLATPLWRGAGCAKCNNSGLRGRVAVAEILSVDATLRRAIAAGRSGDELRSIARESGFRSLIDDARDKITAGHVAPDLALRALSGHDE